MTQAIALSSQMTGVAPGAASSSDILRTLPAMFYINPLIGLFNLLANQTGMLYRTFDDFAGMYSYYAGNLYGVFSHSELIAYVNMAVMAVIGVLFSLLSALFVKPFARRARRRG
jgi:hypothetical protein